jgi:hypothetical protein
VCFELVVVAPFVGAQNVKLPSESRTSHESTGRVSFQPPAMDITATAAATRRRRSEFFVLLPSCPRTASTFRGECSGI